MSLLVERNCSYEYSWKKVTFLQYIFLNISLYWLIVLIAQSAGAVEYTDCFSAEE